VLLLPDSKLRKDQRFAGWHGEIPANCRQRKSVKFAGKDVAARGEIVNGS
jgi:hypothetical protein